MMADTETVMRAIKAATLELEKGNAAPEVVAQGFAITTAVFWALAHGDDWPPALAAFMAEPETTERAKAVVAGFSGLAH